MKVGRYLFLLVSFIVSGCSTMESSLYSGNASRELDRKSLEPYERLADVITLKTDATGKKTGFVPVECFDMQTSERSELLRKCTAARNQAVSVLVMATENLCLKHRQTIYGREASANILLGTLTNLFAGAAAVASSQSTQSLYAALALFSNSERSLINETVYKQMIVTSVDRKIVELMDAKGAALKLELKKPADQLSIQESLQLVGELHSACSFMTGLQLALYEGTQGTNAKKIITLRQNLASIGAEMDIACRKDSTGIQCVEAANRFKAVTAALQPIEASSP